MLRTRNSQRSDLWAHCSFSSSYSSSLNMHLNHKYARLIEVCKRVPLLNLILFLFTQCMPIIDQYSVCRHGNCMTRSINWVISLKRGWWFRGILYCLFCKTRVCTSALTFTLEVISHFMFDICINFLIYLHEPCFDWSINESMNQSINQSINFISWG